MRIEASRLWLENDGRGRSSSTSSSSMIVVQMGVVRGGGDGAKRPLDGRKDGANGSVLSKSKVGSCCLARVDMAREAAAGGGWGMDEERGRGWMSRPYMYPGETRERTAHRVDGWAQPRTEAGFQECGLRVLFVYPLFSLLNPPSHDFLYFAISLVRLSPCARL